MKRRKRLVTAGRSLTTLCPSISCPVADFSYLKLIELWETFLFQLDADDESNPFYSSAPPSASQDAHPAGGGAAAAASAETETAETPAVNAAAATPGTTAEES